MKVIIHVVNPSGTVRYEGVMKCRKALLDASFEAGKDYTYYSSSNARSSIKMLKGSISNGVPIVMCMSQEVLGEVQMLCAEEDIPIVHALEVKDVVKAMQRARVPAWKALL